MLQGAAVVSLVGGIAVGMRRPLGIVLIAAGLLLVAIQRYGRHSPPAPHG
jgi:hypothetical protein